MKKVEDMSGYGVERGSEWNAKGVGKSLGAERAWYCCVAETGWNRQMSSWQIRSSS